MRVIKKSFLWFVGVSGAIGTFGFTILSIACMFYVFTPDSPGNKYTEKMPIILLTVSTYILPSNLIFNLALGELTEMERDDREMLNVSEEEESQ